MDLYRSYLGARYSTFRCAFDSFVAMGGRTIVELGTTRSFVSGGAEGCRSSDPNYWDPDDPGKWDWGAGLFTRMCALHLQDYRPEIHTVDSDPAAVEISKIVSGDYRELIAYHAMSSEEFLGSFSKKIDLLYMDAGEADEDGAQLHLREARLAVSRGLFSDNAIVLVDDVAVAQGGASKGKWSIAYLLGHGFRVKMLDYQAVLQRSVGSP